MGRRQKQRDRELGRIPPQEKGPQELLGERRIIKSVTRQEFEERKKKKNEKETSEISIDMVAKFIGYCFVALLMTDFAWVALSFVARLFGVDALNDGIFWILLRNALRHIF